MQGSRGEPVWRAAGALLGLTLLEVAEFAHHAREAGSRLQLAVSRSVRGMRFLAAMATHLGRGWWRRKRCDICGRRMRLGSVAEHCDWCAAASVPALRMKVDRLEAELDNHKLALTDEYFRASNLRRERDEAEVKADRQEVRAEEAEQRVLAVQDRLREVAAEFEALGAAISAAQDQTTLAWMHVVMWKGLFLRVLGLAMGWHARAGEQEESSRTRVALAEARQRDAEKRADSWKSTVEMYANAWTRELGGRLVPKGHQIDALVVTTRRMADDLEEARAEVERLKKEARASVAQEAQRT